MNGKKILIIFVLLFCVFGTFVGYGFVGYGKEITLKTGHVYSERHPIHKGFEFFNERIQELSGGRISLDIYPNAILGGEKDVLEQQMMGGVSLFTNSPIFYMGKYPEAMVEELPFLYNSDEHWCAAQDGDYGKEFQARVYGKEGLIVLANWPIGLRHFTNNIRPIVQPKDIQGIKFRCAESIIRLKMFEVLGAAAIAMPFNELFTALQQGTVGGQENPISTIESASLQEVQKYLSMSGHIYTGTNITITKKLWDSFTAEEQKWIKQAMDEATAYQRQLNEDAAIETINKIKTELEINDVDRVAFRSAVQPVYDFYIEKYGNEDLIKMIEDANPDEK